MGRNFIPSYRLDTSLHSTQFSKPSGHCAELWTVKIVDSPSRLSPPLFDRRVMRAWWSSRSSKPSPRHSVSGGRFDSYPLRHFINCLPSQPAAELATVQCPLNGSAAFDLFSEWFHSRRSGEKRA